MRSEACSPYSSHQHCVSSANPWVPIVVGVDHEKEVMSGWIHPCTDHLVHVFFERAEHCTEGRGNRILVVRRTGGLVVVVGDVEEL